MADESILHEDDVRDVIDDEVQDILDQDVEVNGQFKVGGPTTEAPRQLFMAGATSGFSEDYDAVGIFNCLLSRGDRPTVDFSGETPAVRSICTALATFGIIIDANA